MLKKSDYSVLLDATKLKNVYAPVQQYRKISLEPGTLSIEKSLLNKNSRDFKKTYSLIKAKSS